MERVRLGDISLSVRTHTCADPTRPPVVLIHGAGGEATEWDAVAGLLGTDRTIHAADLRGHGGSDRPGSYAITDMADDLRALLDHLGGEPDVVAHSMGGLVATGAAGHPQARIRRLVVAEAGMHALPVPVDPPRPAGPLPFDWAVIEQLAPQLRSPDPRWPGIIAAVRVPTMVIDGGPSSFVPHRSKADLAASLPDGRLLEVPGGHDPHRTEPGTFVTAVRAFLDA